MLPERKWERRIVFACGNDASDFSRFVYVTGASTVGCQRGFNCRRLMIFVFLLVVSQPSIESNSSNISDVNTNELSLSSEDARVLMCEVMDSKSKLLYFRHHLRKSSMT